MIERSPSISIEQKSDIVFAKFKSILPLVVSGDAQPGGMPMPLMPAAIAAIPDNEFKTVRFVMKDGSKPVVVLVSGAVLDDIESSTYDSASFFRRFKRYRKRFERMASDKYDKGYVEIDGTVCIKTIDLPMVSSN